MIKSFKKRKLYYIDEDGNKYIYNVYVYQDRGKFNRKLKTLKQLWYNKQQ